MRVIVTGSRQWTDRDQIFRTLNDTHSRYPHPRFTIISGGAYGADSAAIQWVNDTPAAELDLHLPNWTRNGHNDPAAALRRNQTMVDSGADLCLAFTHKCHKCRHNGEPPVHRTHGAWDCMLRASAAGIHVVEYYLHRDRIIAITHTQGSLPKPRTLS